MMKLYGYWRPSAAHRVRIALNLKGISAEHVPAHLVIDGGQQHAADYAAKNPAQLVPSLADICLAAQYYNARCWGLDLTSFPCLTEIEETCLTLPAFAEAQPDAE